MPARTPAKAPTKPTPAAKPQAAPPPVKAPEVTQETAFTLFDPGQEIIVFRPYDGIFKWVRTDGIEATVESTKEEIRITNGTRVSYLGEIPNNGPYWTRVRVLDGEHAGKVVRIFGEGDLTENLPDNAALGVTG